MSNETAFTPHWVSPPGDSIRDILQQRGMAVEQFAAKIRASVSQASDLLSGQVAIDERTAHALAQELGATARFWMTREAQYREDVARQKSLNEQWVRELPIAEMVSYGWLSPSQSHATRDSIALAFFQSKSVQEARQKYEDIASSWIYRLSTRHKTAASSLAAWLRQGEIEAARIATSGWDAKGFRDALQSFCALSLKKYPRHFVPILQAQCASYGVAVVIVRTPLGCPASGAARFISGEKAVIMLSFRFLTDDQFWFSFFHEAAHLLLHGRLKVFLDGTDSGVDEYERQANDFAARILVPAAHTAELAALWPSHANVMRFSLRIGVSPGIVVGQLQHSGRVGYHQLNHLKRRYSWEEE
jgi:plasmid maintenance system antidote protein VapI